MSLGFQFQPYGCSCYPCTSSLFLGLQPLGLVDLRWAKQTRLRRSYKHLTINPTYLLTQANNPAGVHERCKKAHATRCTLLSFQLEVLCRQLRALPLFPHQTVASTSPLMKHSRDEVWKGTALACIDMQSPNETSSLRTRILLSFHPAFHRAHSFCVPWLALRYKSFPRSSVAGRRHGTLLCQPLLFGLTSQNTSTVHMPLYLPTVPT